MSRPEKFLAVTIQDQEQIREKAVAKGMLAYFADFPQDDIPDRVTHESASRNAETAVRETLPALLDAAGGRIPEDRRALLLLRMEEIIPPLSLPEPEVTEEIPPLRVAVAAAIGALAGMLVLPPITWAVLGDRGTGILAGAPLGAMASAFAALVLPRNRRLMRLLAGLLGMATVAEAVRFLGGGSLFLRGFSLLRQKNTSLKRLFLYPLLLALVLLLGKRKTRYDRKQHENAVRRALSAWAEGVLTIAPLAAAIPIPSADDDNRDDFSPLASRILSLEGAPCGDLAAGIAELATEIRNLGFSSEIVPAVFRWSEDAAERYAPFGSVEPGDEVRVEREPLLRDGEVLSRGLVRKVRRS
jgi:hypothetical protein